MRLTYGIEEIRKLQQKLPERVKKIREAIEQRVSEYMDAHGLEGVTPELEKLMHRWYYEEMEKLEQQFDLDIDKLKVRLRGLNEVP